MEDRSYFLVSEGMFFSFVGGKNYIYGQATMISKLQLINYNKISLLHIKEATSTIGMFYDSQPVLNMLFLFLANVLIQTIQNLIRGKNFIFHLRTEALPKT